MTKERPNICTLVRPGPINEEHEKALIPRAISLKRTVAITVRAFGSKSSPEATSELACSYAALALYDDDIAITADKIAAVIAAAGLCVESYWPSLFAKLADKRDIGDLLLNVGCGGGAAAPVSVAAPAGGAAASAATPAVEDKKEEPKEESDDDMGFSLFD